MKDLKTVLLIALSFTVLFLSFYFLNETKTMKQIQKVLAGYTEKIQTKNDFLLSNFEHNTSMTGLTAPDIVCFETSNEGMRLSGMLKDKPLLIYRFNENSCKTCYTEVLERLQAEFPDDFDRLRVFCSNKTERDLLILRRNHGIQFPVYTVPSNVFDWTVEGNNEPYLFVLHPDMKISNIFVPDKDFPEFTKKYIEGVKRLIK